jgi:hypothetical protein
MLASRTNWHACQLPDDILALSRISNLDEFSAPLDRPVQIGFRKADRTTQQKLSGDYDGPN